jgi:hypothetical protein
MKIAHARRAIDSVQVLLGAAFAASPWIVEYSDNLPAAYNALASGAAGAIVALVALIAQWRWLPWATGLVAVWSLAAPWALLFQDAPEAMWSHVAFGVAFLMAAMADMGVAAARPKEQT